MCAHHWTPAPLASGPLYETRRRQRLSRRQLAERSGVSLRTIKRIELGDGGPEYPATRLALAMALGVRVDELRPAATDEPGSGSQNTGSERAGPRSAVEHSDRSDLLQHARRVAREART